MMGYKIRNLKTFTSFSLETQVPEDNFYRQVEKCIDLSFVRDLVCHLYSDFGRPSIDPVIFFKIQLIAFFEGIRSERLLTETVSLNLAHRWFIGIVIVSFRTGTWMQGVILLFGFYGVVNWIDILLRPRLLSEEANINFALFILAIFGGLAWVGILGLFYGPVLMLLLVTTIEIYAER